MARQKRRNILIWVAAFCVAFVLFYASNHLVMSSQGLPLNLDLTATK